MNQNGSIISQPESLNATGIFQNGHRFRAPTGHIGLDNTEKMGAVCAGNIEVTGTAPNRRE